MVQLSQTIRQRPLEWIDPVRLIKPISVEPHQISHLQVYVPQINETSEMVKSLVESEMNAVVKLKEKKIYPWNRNIKTFHYL